MPLEIKSMIVRRLLARLKDANTELHTTSEYLKGLISGQIGVYADILNEYGCNVKLSMRDNRYITATIDGVAFPVQE